MLQDAELDARVREAQASLATILYEAYRSKAFAKVAVEVDVEHGLPVRFRRSIQSSERFAGPAEAASDGRTPPGAKRLGGRR